jgi:hypothetical protein
LHAILPALILLAPALPAAEKNNTPPDEPRKKLSAISLLPNGSELDGVMLPRYDENHRLTGVLKSGKMTLLTNELIAGEAVTIGFFNPDGSPRGRVDLVKALFNQAKGFLEARESVTIQSDRINARGSGLIYAFGQGEGFLTGPATTWILSPTETTMNSRKSPRRAAAAISLMAATTTLIAAAPPGVPTPEQQTALKTNAASAAPAHADASRTARENLREELDASAAATTAATAFLEQAEIAAKTTTTASAQPAGQPLDVKPGPTDTVVSCDGGMYFDADEGLFVYLKNVRVADPRFALSGARELKIFLAKKPVETPAPAAPAGKPSMGLGAKFGDVERIVATGAVRILQKEAEAGKQPVEASGAIFSYHPGSGEIVLTGGYPWVKQGNTFMRAKEPNLSLRIQKSGSFVTEGNWDMGGTLDQKNR